MDTWWTNWKLIKKWWTFLKSFLSLGNFGSIFLSLNRDFGVYFLQMGISLLRVNENGRGTFYFIKRTSVRSDGKLIFPFNVDTKANCNSSQLSKKLKIRCLTSNKDKFWWQNKKTIFGFFGIFGSISLPLLFCSHLFYAR